jgi:ubiquinone/menaquinone biosynthesis C-methylase UbiE
MMADTKDQNQELSRAFDDVAVAHESYTRQHPLKRLYYRDLIEQFLRHVAPSPGDAIVELACGNGYYGGLCRQRGADVTFLDINATMLDMVRRAHGANTPVVQGDIRRLPFADASFDKTLCFGAMPPLPTLDDMAQAVAEFVRITRPGGLVFFTYNPPHLLRRLSVAHARFIARFFLPSLRTLPFIDGRTDGCQRHQDMRAIVARTGREAHFGTAGTGVFGFACIRA